MLIAGTYGIVRYLWVIGQFDREGWLAGPKWRWRMKHDLMSRHLRVGMSKQEVRALLGEPDAQSEYDRQHNIDRYDLGHLTLDYWLLTLGHDGADRLVRMEITQT